MKRAVAAYSSVAELPVIIEERVLKVVVSVSRTFESKSYLVASNDRGLLERTVCVSPFARRFFI